MRRLLLFILVLLAAAAPLAQAYAPVPKLVLPKLYGPDFDGVYGWQNGTGGFEADAPADVLPLGGKAVVTGEIKTGAKELIGAAAKSGVRAFEVGPADDLLARSLRGDKLDIHHVGQAHPFEQIIPGYDRATAPAIAIPRAQHSAIPTVHGSYTGTARDQLAKDIRDLRNYTDVPNSALRQLIELNKQLYPNAFRK